MEILTNILTEGQFRQELADTLRFLLERGISEAAVSFGFTPDCPDLPDAGEPHVIPVADVASVVAERERTKGFRLGVYDCSIEPSGLAVRFLFCNDRDVHATSSSAELLDLVRARWRAKGFSVYPDDLQKA